MQLTPPNNGKIVKHVATLTNWLRHVAGAAQPKSCAVMYLVIQHVATCSTPDLYVPLTGHLRLSHAACIHLLQPKYRQTCLVPHAPRKPKAEQKHVDVLWHVTNNAHVSKEMIPHPLHDAEQPRLTIQHRFCHSICRAEVRSHAATLPH